MNQQIDKVVILGGGSAGFLSAVALKRLVPELSVVIIRSAKIPVIGVGESTTAFIPQFLHNRLGLDRKQFYDAVHPIWKLGIRLEWGAAEDSHFNYTFDNVMDVGPPALGKLSAYHCLDDLTDASHFYAIMDRGTSPCVFLPNGQYQVHEHGGYHIENKAYLAYLERKSGELGVKLIEGDVVGVPLDERGYVTGLRLEDGRALAADFFVDCSGFGSLLLGQTLDQPYHSYSDSLFCDRALVGSWTRDDQIYPFTTVETMEHGWCWRIEFEDHVTRGYVFSSAFCQPDEAAKELRAKNPRLSDDLRTLKFPSGRYEDYWVKNVAAVGNASGFVEPLEATALHLIIEQVYSICNILNESNRRLIPEMIPIENKRFRGLWDEVRDFLALHYKFNRRSDSEFWRYCREKTPLNNARELVDFYSKVGPSTMCKAFIPPGSMFGFNGYMAMLIGQRVATEYRNEFSRQQTAQWNAYREQIRQQIGQTVTVRQALQVVQDPNWQWPSRGF